MKPITQMIVALALTGIQTTGANAHVLPWREGESHMKDFGSCAKGPCMRRADFSLSKPHHHHGARVALGENRHSWRCEVKDAGE